MNVNNRDLLYEKEVIKLHAEKMRNLIRVHSGLIFKNKNRINRNYDGEPITEEAKEIEKRQEEIL